MRISDWSSDVCSSDLELTWRQEKRMAARLRHAKLRHRAVPEDIDYRTPRGLDRRFMETLLKGDWIKGHDNFVITGPTGTGKSWLSCAIGNQACRDNLSRSEASRVGNRCVSKCRSRGWPVL